MLPPGLSAQPAERADHLKLRALHPATQTTVRLVVGGCSCDLVRARDTDARADERHHRDRFRRAGWSRADVIAALERHRRGASVIPPGGGWPRALAAFVAEHARNAGETLYLLRFTTEPPSGVESGSLRLTASEVMARPDIWLTEHQPVLVGR
jgi:hypothetical protein